MDWIYGFKLHIVNYWLRKKSREGRFFIPIDIKPGMEGKAEMICPNGVWLRLSG